MLSKELRNLAFWLRARREFRQQTDQPVDVRGDVIVSNVLEELADQAERLESHTRMTGAEVAEMVAREGIR